jgi:hypothetical protein
MEFQEFAWPRSQHLKLTFMKQLPNKGCTHVDGSIDNLINKETFLEMKTCKNSSIYVPTLDILLFLLQPK